jgi:hypothetical protein
MEPSKTLRVVDSSCTQEAPKRTHYVTVGGQDIGVDFIFGEQTILPYEVGIKFMLDGFEVFESDSEVSIGRPPQTDETIKARIGQDQVIADLSELTETALKLRVATLPGGEVFTSDATTRDEVLAFLKNGGNVAPVSYEDETNIEDDASEITFDAEAEIEEIDAEAEVIDLVSDINEALSDGETSLTSSEIANLLDQPAEA